MRERANFLLVCLLFIQATSTFGQYESSAPIASAAPQQVAIQPSPTTKSPEPAIDCAGHADGLYVRNPNECNDGFYKCANNRSFYYRCPTGLFFSIEDAQCEYRQLIPACGGQRPVEATPAPTPIATAQNQAPQSYGQQAQQLVLVAQPPQSPQTYSQPAPIAPVQNQTPYSQPAQQPTTQAPAPIFAQQTTQPAQTYVQRETRSPTQQVVPSYHISYAAQQSAPVAPVAPVQSPQQYSQQPTYQQQVAPQLVASTQAPVDFNCGSNPDGYYYKQQCTSTYYSCIGGIAAKLQCPGGTVYDPTVHACDYSGVCGQPRQQSTTTQQPMVNYGYGWQAPTTQAPSTECVGKLDGFYARGHCVPRYLHCSNGLSFDLACPSGLVFRNDACTFLSDCLSPTTPAPIAIQTPAMPTPPPLTWCRDNNKGSGYFSQGCSGTYYSCNGGFTTQLSCPSNLVYDQSAQVCEFRQYVPACGGMPTTTSLPIPVAPAKPVNFNCDNKPTGYYTNPGCQSVYYHCNGGFAVELQCPANLAYDHSINACEERQYVQSCGGQPRPPTTTSLPSLIAPLVNFNCDNRPTGYYTNPGCQTSYFYCSGGFGAELQCPANLAYDHSINACEERQYVQSCGGQPRPATTTPLPAPVAPLVNFNCANKPTGYYTSNSCSSTYYHCNGGFAVELQCPANLAYDHSINACEERQFVRECGGSPRPATTTSLPAPVAAARPVNFNCAGKSDGYYSTGCTAIYYSCNGGTAIEFSCPPGTDYSSQLHACDYRGNVPACGGVLPTTTQTAPIAVAGGSLNSQSQYGYAPQPQAPVFVQQTTTQAPVYQQPQTQAPVYQQPQTQAPVFVQQPQTQAPVYQQPQTQAPVFVQQPQTQAPVYQQPQTQAPVFVQQPQTQAPVYQQPQTQAPVFVQQTTPAPTYQPQQQYGPSAPSYQQPSQYGSQAPTAPMALVQSQTDDSENINQCSHLQNGIYGRRCSRHYFVCTDHKIFEFTCPSGYAYDRTIARCGPVQQIQGCGSAPTSQPTSPQQPARYLRYRK